MITDYKIGGLYQCIDNEGIYGMGLGTNIILLDFSLVENRVQVFDIFHDGKIRKLYYQKHESLNNSFKLIL